MDKVGLFIVLPENQQADISCKSGCTVWIERDTEFNKEGWKATVEGFPKIFARGETIEEIDMDIVEKVYKAYAEMGESEKTKLTSNLVDSTSNEQINKYIRIQISHGKFYYVASILRNSPEKVDRSTLNLLANYLMTCDKKPVGTPSQHQRNNRIYLDYSALIGEGMNKSRAKQKIMKQYSITDVNFRQIMSRIGRAMR